MKNFRFYILAVFAVVSMTNCKKENSNIKPLLDIVSPDDNFSIFKGDSVTIKVQANDPDGLIEAVDFKVNHQSKFQSKIQPYEYVWHTNDALGGSNRITIIVTDNKGLSDSMSITVKVKTIIPVFTTLPISFIGTTYAISGGNVFSNGIPPINQRGLCWNKIGDPTIYDGNVRVDGDTGVFACSISGLELGIKYFVKAYVQTTDTVVYGNELSFTTDDSYVSDSGTFVDNRDLTRYKWIKIGKQIWMAENLKYLANGINAYIPDFYDASYSLNYPGTKPIKDIQSAKLSDNYKLFGCLYLPGQEICPQGWHIPSTKEWLELINYLGGDQIAGGLLKESGEVHWKTPNVGATNLSLFRALPAGIVNTKYSDIYSGKNEYSYFYTSDIGNIVIRFDSEIVGVYNKSSYWNGWEYYSIRCVKD